MSVSRRAFLATGVSAGAALLIGFNLRGHLDAEPSGPAAVNPFDAWLRLDNRGHVTLIVAKSEMGQGVFTALPMILADELGVAWDQIAIEQAPTKPAIYQHGTGGSSSVRTSWLPLRQAGAAAREMLIAAAANLWQVDPATCRVENGVVSGAGHSASFAELIPAAARLPVPDFTTVRLKDARDLRLVGTSPVRRDVPAKIDGEARFGLDVRVPGMQFAVIARCPTLDGTPRRFDATRAKQVPGVRDVFQVPAMVRLDTSGPIKPSDPVVRARGGIAVVADTTWAAIRGRQLLEIEWDHGANVNESTAALRAQFERLIAEPGEVVRNDGDAEAAFARAPKQIEAVYELPLQAHVCMEPMNCTVHVQPDRVDAWVPTQFPQLTRDAIAIVARLPPDRVAVNTTFMGGGFGRRAGIDWVVEATQISQRTRTPIQVVWTREDDVQYDFYRQASMHRLRAGFDADGRARSWSHRMVSTSGCKYLPSLSESEPWRSEVWGAADMPYDIPNVRLEYTPAQTNISVGWWRSVEHSFTCFVVESFIDEMAHAVGVDPLEFRIRLIAQAPRVKLPWADESAFDRDRMIAVLKLAAARSGWGTPAPAGRARGLACLYGFSSYIAEVAEVSIERNRPRVHRVTCAVDCGQVVHPSNAAAQIEGAVVFGLGATLKSEITIEKGQAQQRNFDTFEVMRLPETPLVDVHFVPSTAAPTGCGEPGVPPVAPAVANALFALTGTRSRRLPIRG